VSLRKAWPPATCIRTTSEEGSVYEFLASAYLAKDDKPAAIAELERYVKAGGRNPDSIKLLAKQLEDAGRNKEAADALNRLNYIYPMDNDQHQALGGLWMNAGNVAGAIREFRAVVAHNPIDPARSHYDLARAYQLNHEPSGPQTNCWRPWKQLRVPPRPKTLAGIDHYRS